MKRNIDQLVIFQKLADMYDAKTSVASNIGIAQKKKQSKHGTGGQKMAKCEACKELSKVYDGSQELIVTHFVNRKNGRPTFLLVQGNWRPESVKIEVNFCPWCGRCLRGNEDGK